MRLETAVLTAIILVYTIGIFLGISLFTEHFLADEEAARFHTWLQFVTGTWPNWEQAKISRRSFGFSTAVTIQFLLSVGAIGGFFLVFVGILRRLTLLEQSERGRTMKFQEMIELRDGVIRRELTNIIPTEQRTEEKERVFDEIFEKANKYWQDNLLPILADSPQKYEEMIRRLKEDILAH